MHVKFKEELYRTPKAAMLFWKDLTQTITDWGLEVNPYD